MYQYMFEEIYTNLSHACFHPGKCCWLVPVYKILPSIWETVSSVMVADFDLLTLTVKPIFHQNAKYPVSGVGVGQCNRRQNFELPNAIYTNMLVYFA